MSRHKKKDPITELAVISLLVTAIVFGVVIPMMFK